MKNSFSCHYYNTSPRGFTNTENSTTSLLEDFRRISKITSGEYLSYNEVVRLPLDEKILESSLAMAKKYHTSQLKYIIIIGIGGSNLGTKAVYDAVRGQCDFLIGNFPKLIFLDTVGINLIHDLREILKNSIHHKEEIIINLVSKSGNTVESVVNFEILMSDLSRRIDGIETRVICTTDEDSKLYELAKSKSYGILTIPKMVGGRFSVFSSVGIFPLLLAGIDVKSFRDGGEAMLTQCLDIETGNQHARRSAEIIFAEMMNGASLLNIFHFIPELESLGKWERQLTAESLGKEKDLSGKVVHTGITPIVSIGSTDLHSMAQLYFGGPRDKFTMLIKTEKQSKDRVPTNGLLDGLVDGIRDKTPSDIMDAIYQGVMMAYRKNNLPFAEVQLADTTPYSVGAYMEWRMLTIIHLATLLHINPYDQPNVEDYKRGARETLGALHN